MQSAWRHKCTSWEARLQRGHRLSPALPALPPGGSPDSVDVLGGLVRRVELYDPVHGRDVQPASGNVCAEQHPGVLSTKQKNKSPTKTGVRAPQHIRTLSPRSCCADIPQLPCRVQRNVVVRAQHGCMFRVVQGKTERSRNYGSPRLASSFQDLQRRAEHTRC